MDQPFSVVNINEQAWGGPKPSTPVHGAPAFGRGLHTNGHLGADMLFVPPNGRFPLHTHPGDHLLLVVRGVGSVTVGGVEHPTHPGDLYMVDGGVEHAVGAGPGGQWLIAIGAPHKAVDDPARMSLVAEAV